MELRGELTEKITSYTADPQALESVRATPILLLVGITGAGKDAVQNRLIKEHLDEYHFIVSHTTRAPRINNGNSEHDGVDYHFVDFDTMEQLIDKHAFVEANIVHFDNVYGTSIAEIKAAQADNRVALTDIEVKGVKNYVDLGMNVKPIFLLPPSYEVWWQRLNGRHNGSMDNHDIHKRMETALNEIETAVAADYFYIVINDKLKDTVELVNDIAHNVPVERHYPKALATAEQFITRLKSELAHE